MKVKVYGIYRREEYGYEYEGELVYLYSDFFVIEYQKSWMNKPERKVFHMSTHRYEEIFTHPYPVGSYVHLTRNDCKCDSSFQKKPMLVWGYEQTKDGWCIKISDYNGKKPFPCEYPLSQYTIVQIPANVVNAFLGIVSNYP